MQTYLPDFIIDGATARVDTAPAVVVIKAVQCSAAWTRLAAWRHCQVTPVPVSVSGRIRATQFLKIGSCLRSVLREVRERLWSSGERMLLIRPVVVVIVTT